MLVAIVLATALGDLDEGLQDDLTVQFSHEDLVLHKYHLVHSLTTSEDNNNAYVVRQSWKCSHSWRNTTFDEIRINLSF